MKNILKKAISVLLITVMVLCSAPLSGLLGIDLPDSGLWGKVAAWTVNDDPDDISFTVKFFRESPAGSGNWIETENAAPGEKVKARIYIETGYYTYGGETAFIYDRDFFNVTGLNDGVRTPLTVNQNYAGPSDDAYGAGEYNLAAGAFWIATDDYDSWFNEWNKHFYMDYIVEEIEKDPDFFKYHDFVYSSIEFGSTINNSKLADDDWMYEFELVVADNTVTNTVDETGEAEVPPYYYSKDRYITDENGEYLEDVELPVNVSKGENGKFRNKNIGMWDWYPEFTTTPGVLSTTSEIVFDMGLVDENGAWYEDTYTTVYGIISKEADLNAITNPVHPDGSLVFSHWSTQKPGEGAAQEKVSTIAYDYDALTLYAVWTEAPDVSYTLKEFYMNADGSYPTDVEGVKKEAAPNSTVSAPESTDPLYTLNAEMSSKDVVINADSSSVVNAYYERNKYKLVYHYEDNTGSVIDPYTVRFGAELPAFEANPSGQPDRVGYTFLGWATEEGGEPLVTLPSVMPTEDLHLYAVYEEPIIIDFIFDAGEGTFADGESVKKYSYKYGEATEAPEVPTALGKTFVVWDDDIPATAYETKTFEAIYEDTLCIVTFRADTDNDGEYETIVAEEEYVYGEKLYPEYAPENYPVDVWKLEDGTSVVFFEDEEVAYTVTEDVVFYTVGSDEYPARFYWSEEDMESGAEPYATVYVKYDEEVSAPSDPEMPGYDFVGWATKSDPEYPEEFLGVMDTDGEDFVAVWSESVHEITFIDYEASEGGTQAPVVEYEYARSEISYNGVVSLPDEPVFLDGKSYKFIGWFDVEGNEYKEGDIYRGTNDLILYSRWEKVEYFIEFYVDEEWICGYYFPYGEPIVYEYDVPEKAGYTFAGWVDYEGNPMPETMPANDAAYYATYTLNHYEVIYDANGGVFNNNVSFIEFNNIEYGAEIPVPEITPTRDRYLFVKWAPEVPEIMPDADIVFMAVWEKIPEPEEQEYEIYISYPNPANPDEAIEKFIITDSALPDTTVEVIKSGEDKTADKAHTYEEILASVKVDGIEPDYDNRPEILTVTEGTNKLIVPFKLTEYIIEFNPNGGKFGESEAPVIVNGTWGQAVEAPADPTRTGYTFTGWDNDVPATFTEDVVINATWEIQSHNAIFVVVDENGKEVVRIPVEYNYGETIVAPEYSAPAGYVFNGWDIPEGTTMGEEDVTFTSKLEPIYYSLSYKISGLPAYKSVTAPLTQGNLRVGYENPVAAAPEVDGYTFDGWYNGRLKYDCDGNDTIYMPAENVVLTGVYTPKEYTITFDSNGAEDVESVTYYCDEVVEMLPEVSREGCTFLGWYYDDTMIEAGFVMPAKDVILTAKWVCKSYFVEFYDGNEWLSGGNQIYGEPIVFENILPEKTGYTFAGWVDIEGNPMPETVPAHEAAYYATYTINTYTAYFYLTYDDYTAGNYWQKVETVYGQKIVFPEAPKVNGMEFDAWDNDATIMGAEDIHFVAMFTDIEYLVEVYDENGELLYDWISYWGEEIAEDDLGEFTKEGYNFAGWYTDDTLVTKHTFPVIVNGDVFFYAKFEKINDFNVTWIINGEETVVTYSFGDEIIIPEVPEKKGHTLIGWSAEIPETMPAQNLEFTAIYEPNTYNIDWCIDGLIMTDTCKYGEVIETPNLFKKKGYTFDGWTPEIPEIMPDHDLTFEAVWIINTHTVTWDVDGVITEVEYDYNESIIPIDNPEKEGYTFIGWDADIPSLMPDCDLYFTAEWELNKYNITWITDGEETVIEYYYGEEITVPALAEKTGYTFVGWTPEIPDFMPAKDLVFNDVWTANFYDAVFVTNGGLFSDGDSIKRIPTEFDSVISAPSNPERDSYLFAGWSYNGKNIGSDFGVMDSVEGKLFEALWIMDSSATYAVEYHMMNTVGGYDVTTMYFSASANQPVSVRPVVGEGFVINEKNSVLSGTVNVDDSLVLKVYIDRISYDFIINTDGETETVSYYYGAMISEPIAPVREGYEFIGWDKEIPATMPANDITVTAKFKEKEEDKTYAKLNIATPEKRTLYYGESITLYASVKNLPEDAKIKWYVEGDGVSIKPSSNGKSCKVTSTSNGNVVIRAMVVDSKGNTVKGSDGKPVADFETIYSEVTFWQIIVNFFRSLFSGR